MKHLILTILALVVAGNVAADTQLDGAYERVSLTNTRTGESPEAANRQGLLIMAHGHYSMMTMNPERRYVDEEQQASMAAADEIAYLKQWLDINGHTGRYEVDGDALIWHRDISENPREVGTISRLNFEWRDALLVIYFTLPNGDRYDWIWRRLD